MFAVIFRAQIKALDEEYESTALQLRDLAMEHYGCVDFVSHSDGERESPDHRAILPNSPRDSKNCRTGAM